jgi:predicted RNA-binding Zn ribbon-like protein
MSSPQQPTPGAAEQHKSDLDSLKADVEKAKTVQQSAVTLLNGMSQKLKQMSSQDVINPADLQALAHQLEQSTTALATAVSANTPAAGK